MNAPRERGDLKVLLHIPTREQVSKASMAVFPLTRALAQYQASNDKNEREAIAHATLFPILSHYGELFHTLAKAELHAVRTAGRAVLAPFISSVLLREFVLSKFDREMRMRLALDLAFVEYGSEYLAESQLEIFRAAVATPRLNLRALAVRLLRRAAEFLERP